MTLEDFKNEINNEGMELGVRERGQQYFILLPRNLTMVTLIYREVP